LDASLLTLNFSKNAVALFLPFSCILTDRLGHLATLTSSPSGWVLVCDSARTFRR
jgi:hypothetical protein